MPEEHEKLYTLEEVAKILGMHTNTVRRMIDQGELKTIRIGAGILRKQVRIAQSDLDDYLTRSRG